jgi:uncharacterized protein (TIGR02996 family)
MTEQEALLRAILEDPADDTVRLVYADWLDENVKTKPCPRCNGGLRLVHVNRETFTKPPLQPKDLCRMCEGTSSVTDGGYKERAELIRVQVELARMPQEVVGTDWVKTALYDGGVSAEKDEDPVRERLQRRSNELLSTMLDVSTPTQFRRTVAHVVWAGKLNNKEWDNGTYRRGFIDRAVLHESTLFGGECKGCRATERHGPSENVSWSIPKCANCLGTKRACDGIKTLFNTHPVTKVMLAGANPNGVSFTNEYSWYFHPTMGREYLHWLPICLASTMRALYPVPDVSRGFRSWHPYEHNSSIAVFIDAEAARRALSETIIALGRKLVGLGPLEFTP